MVQLHEVEAQLKEIGCNFKFFGRPEIRELAKLLTPGEKIAQCVNGFYEGGFALLCVTSHRLLLIDRKPMFLTVEDIRFDMIAEVDLNHRLMNSSTRIYTLNKSLVFTSWNHSRLRALVDYLQQRVMEIRQHTMMQQFETPAAPAQSVSQDTAAPQSANPTAAQEEVVPQLAYVAMQGSAQSTAPTPAARLARYAASPYHKLPLLSRRNLPHF